MYKKGKIGRKEIDHFELNREIAYKGKIGRQRKNFCISYIKQKQEVFKAIAEAQIKMAASKRETITCQKGCSFCCVEYVEASLQEGEAIVYYLYQNERVLTAFLQVYPRWREKVRESGDLFKRAAQFYSKAADFDFIERRHQFDQFVCDITSPYAIQNIPCPFLRDGICSIYEVRPMLCAARFATTPAEWCHPSNPNKPRFYNTVETDILFDLSFYYQNLKKPTWSFMPVLVYEILKAGSLHLSKVPSLENLEAEIMNDPEVRTVLQRYLKTR